MTGTNVLRDDDADVPNAVTALEEMRGLRFIVDARLGSPSWMTSMSRCEDKRKRP